MVFRSEMRVERGLGTAAEAVEVWTRSSRRSSDGAKTAFTVFAPTVFGGAKRSNGFLTREADRTFRNERSRFSPKRAALACAHARREAPRRNRLGRRVKRDSIATLGLCVRVCRRLGPVQRVGEQLDERLSYTWRDVHHDVAAVKLVWMRQTARVSDHLEVPLEGKRVVADSHALVRWVETVRCAFAPVRCDPLAIRNRSSCSAPWRRRTPRSA